MSVNNSLRHAATPFAMRLQTISAKPKHVINSLRAIIEKEETEHFNEDTRGWQYGGEQVAKLVADLRTDIKEELGQSIHVDFCTVRHFFRGVNILEPGPAKRVLVIPISGTSTLSSGGQLPMEMPIDTYCYIDAKSPLKPTLSGEDIDVVFVVYEVTTGDI